MANVKVFNMEGNEVGTMELKDEGAYEEHTVVDTEEPH